MTAVVSAVLVPLTIGFVHFAGQTVGVAETRIPTAFSILLSGMPHLRSLS
jgi:hypothetical protein